MWMWPLSKSLFVVILFSLKLSQKQNAYCRLFDLLSLRTRTLTEPEPYGGFAKPGVEKDMDMSVQIAVFYGPVWASSGLFCHFARTGLYTCMALYGTPIIFVLIRSRHPLLQLLLLLFLVTRNFQMDKKCKYLNLSLFYFKILSCINI